jgi:cytochrome c5
MNLRAILLAVIVLAGAALPGLSQAGAPPSSAPAKQPKPASTAAPAGGKVHDGQKVFEQNCSRCHNAPQGFSPNIATAVARHMRTRANLSQEDYEALLRFFNP